MDDHLLVEALRERDPAAPAAVYDAHADRLYAYCWFQLRNRDAAQVALRDTFIMADAHIGELRDPDRFAPWLYAVARLECARRLPPRDQPPDVPVARHDQEDVDQRIMAWQAVLALRPVSREILELRVRHQFSVPDLAAVFDMPLKDAQSTLETAHGELEEALTAEMLAHQGPYGCAERAALLRDRHGVHTHDLNHRLMEHAEECSVCAAFRPRTVSAAKVYGLLPDADPPAELRLRIMSCFFDPELVGYRLFVTGRVTEFTLDGFPVQSIQPARTLWAPSTGGQSWLHRLRRSRSPSQESALEAQAVRVGVAVAAVALLAGGGIASVMGFLATGRDDVGTAAGPRPTTVPGVSQRTPPGGRTDRPDGSGYVDAAPVSATFPLGSRTSSAPPTALRTPSPVPAPGSGSAAEGALVAYPLFLDLAGGSGGSINLWAEGGPVTWRAKTRGPISVHPASGRLEAGRSVTVQVEVSRRPDSRGEGTITLHPGGSQVHVTWRPGAPSPDPTPSRTGPGVPSAPSGTGRPGLPSPSQPGRPSSSEPASSEPPPSNDDPETLPPSAEPSAPATATSPGTSPASSP